MCQCVCVCVCVWVCVRRGVGGWEGGWGGRREPRASTCVCLCVCVRGRGIPGWVCVLHDRRSRVVAAVADAFLNWSGTRSLSLTLFHFLSLSLSLCVCVCLSRLGELYRVFDDGSPNQNDVTRPSSPLYWTIRPKLELTSCCFHSKTTIFGGNGFQHFGKWLENWTAISSKSIEKRIAKWIARVPNFCNNSTRRNSSTPNVLDSVVKTR